MDKLEKLKREIADYEREAFDPRAWGHHRAYAAKRADELRRELAEIEQRLTPCKPTDGRG